MLMKVVIPGKVKVCREFPTYSLSLEKGFRCLWGLNFIVHVVVPFVGWNSSVSCPPGMQEYSSRTLATISGAILGVVVPLALIIALVWYCLVHKKRDVEETETSWDFRKARLSKEVPLRQHRTPINSFMPSGAPGSDRSSSSGGGGVSNGVQKGQGKKRRSYDGVYRTHEPLPGASSVDFGKKLWDLEEEETSRGLDGSSSPPESEITSSDFSSTISDRKGQGGVVTDIY